uniref:Uncharacterized protein n=1 Tax=Romanomermis culicivorax TaxID=13658 RepID=A0A915I522_ROMCU
MTSYRTCMSGEWLSSKPGARAGRAGLSVVKKYRTRVFGSIKPQNMSGYDVHKRTLEKCLYALRSVLLKDHTIVQVSSSSNNDPITKQDDECTKLTHSRCYGQPIRMAVIIVSVVMNFKFLIVCFTKQLKRTDKFPRQWIASFHDFNTLFILNDRCSDPMK